MRITVFGATGNIGRRVIAEALSRGHEVNYLLSCISTFIQIRNIRKLKS